MKRLRHWLEYYAVRLVICVVQTIPLETCATWTRLVAYVATHWIPIRRQVIDDNLKLAYPELSASDRRRLAQRMWEHLLLMLCEIAHVRRRIHHTNWRDHVHMHRLREYCRILLDTRPKVVLSAHFGNFEAAGYVAGLLGFPSYTIARKLDNPYLDRYVNRFRSATGQYILPKQGSATAVQKVLSSGGILTLLGDQNAGPKGCWVNFFGHPASCHKAIALFSVKSGAPMMVMYAKRIDAPLQFEIGMIDSVDPRHPEAALASVESLTQWYNDRLEQLIREAPEQYWWLHRRWKGTPPPSIVRRLAAPSAHSKSAA